MAKHHLRKDSICENCGHIVEERFCTHCGQENVETRQTFAHLVRHFMEDLTHYESNIWKTVKYLLFRPAYLTKCYLAGKRMTYVAPVKLYIFISFIAFFLPHILPDFNAGHRKSNAYLTVGNSLDKSGKTLGKMDSDTQKTTILLASGHTMPSDFLTDSIKTEQEYDSIQSLLPKDQKSNFFNRFMDKQFIKFNNMSKEEKKEKFVEQLVHNFPKALFIYLPLFAFVVWLFHSKKKWFYFDHAIFTLHCFSFLLLMITLISMVNKLIPWYFMVNPAWISNILSVAGLIWAIHYFYRAHRKLYSEKWVISWLKSGIIIFVNACIFLVVLIAFVFFQIAAIH